MTNHTLLLPPADVQTIQVHRTVKHGPQCSQIFLFVTYLIFCYIPLLVFNLVGYRSRQLHHLFSLTGHTTLIKCITYRIITNEL